MELSFEFINQTEEQVEEYEALFTQIIDTTTRLLKIDDDYVKNTATEIEKWAAQLQTYFGTYQTCLENILSDAIMEGDTHDALERLKS